MSVYASSSEQVLLGLLWAIRDLEDDVAAPKLEEIFREFQSRRGVSLYGPVSNADPAAISEDLHRDLAALHARGLVELSENPHARVTFLGAPVASSIRLGPPLDELVRIARDRLGQHAA